MPKINKAIETLKDSSKKVKAEKMGEILAEMQVKLSEIDTLRKELQKEQYSSISPSKSRAMLEEIKVPSIEMIRDEGKKKK